MTVEEAIAEARHMAGYRYGNERQKEMHDAALRRIALAAYESMPCMGMVGEWDCLRRAATSPTVLCDRCDKVQEYSA